MIDHCDSSFLDRRFAGERIPLSRQLPGPSQATGSETFQGCQVRHSITVRDKRWAECKLFQVPSSVAVSTLREQNAGIVKMLSGQPAPFQPDLTHVELLLCKLCEIFCLRCEVEILAATRRPGSVSVIDPEFIRRSFELAAADEEELPPGAL